MSNIFYDTPWSCHGNVIEAKVRLFSKVEIQLIQAIIDLFNYLVTFKELSPPAPNEERVHRTQIP